MVQSKLTLHRGVQYVLSLQQNRSRTAPNCGTTNFNYSSIHILQVVIFSARLLAPEVRIQLTVTAVSPPIVLVVSESMRTQEKL